MKKNEYYIGVDPGKEPAICLLSNKGEILNIDLVKSKDDFPYVDWLYKLSEYDNIIQGEHFSIVSEYPHSVFGASAKSNFSFGGSVKATVMGLHTISEDITLVLPKAWQKTVMQESDVVKVKSKKDTKATALNCAKRILGSKWDLNTFLPTARSKVANHNLIDAYLIAYHGYLIDN